MKIAMVSEHANPLATVGGVDAGGQNIHVAALASRLVERGNDVTVFTRRDDTTSPTRVEVPQGYVVEHVPAGPPTEVPKDELLRHMSAFAAYLHARWREEAFDLAHAHFWMSGLAASFAAGLVGMPVTMTFHALGTVKRRQQGCRDTSPPTRIALEADLCRRVDHVIATCNDEVAELEDMGLEGDRVSVVPCGVDLPADHALPPRDGFLSPPRLLVLGRLVERKGVGNVIEALARLPQASLTIAGGPVADALQADPEIGRLVQLAGEVGVSDRVRFVGRVPHDDVPALMREHDVVVAVPWYEPFGIVPVEAMACGRAVVGSAVGGLLDTILPGTTGELVPPRRPDLLAAALRDLVADPERCRRYGAAGFARAEGGYQWSQVAATTEDVYQSVLDRHAATVGAGR
jgi:glycosyltransferase involved in cell wall biosynthesis